jgi:hypothetical protein
MVPSSVIADGEHLMCGGFSLSETICLGNFKFIANYFTAKASPLGGAKQAPFSCAQLTMGLLPRGGP